MNGNLLQKLVQEGEVTGLHHLWQFIRSESWLEGILSCCDLETVSVHLQRYKIVHVAYHRLQRNSIFKVSLNDFNDLYIICNMMKYGEIYYSHHMALTTSCSESRINSIRDLLETKNMAVPLRPACKCWILRTQYLRRWINASIFSLLPICVLIAFFNFDHSLRMFKLL